MPNVDGQFRRDEHGRHRSAAANGRTNRCRQLRSSQPGRNARYLNDVTDQIADMVQFEFADGSAPTVVRDAAKPEVLYVLMPMRV